MYKATASSASVYIWLESHDDHDFQSAITIDAFKIGHSSFVIGMKCQSSYRNCMMSKNVLEEYWTYEIIAAEKDIDPIWLSSADKILSWINKSATILQAKLKSIAGASISIILLILQGTVQDIGFQCR